MIIAGSSLKGCGVAASDGVVGTVSDLLFDDDGWSARWFAVEVGTLLSPRTVLVRAASVRPLDRNRAGLDVAASRAEVEAGAPAVEPDAGSGAADGGVSYGLDPILGGGCIGAEALAAPLSMGTRFGHQAWRAAGASHPSRGNPRLHGIAAIGRYRVRATDGEIGHVANILIDDHGWRVHAIVVDTGNWRPGRHVLLPPLALRTIDDRACEIGLGIARDAVRAAPRWDTVDAMTALVDASPAVPDNARGIGFR